jgi:hypothetical protein
MEKCEACRLGRWILPPEESGFFRLLAFREHRNTGCHRKAEGKGIAGGFQAQDVVVFVLYVAIPSFLGKILPLRELGFCTYLSLHP